jgi:hypothetical protein
MSFLDLEKVADNIRMESSMIVDGWQSLPLRERIGIAFATIIPTIFFSTFIYAISPLVGR